ncbi:hypothetical protein EW146_g3729 [Bondarzewia mesenterica]|uniref:Protein CPL1-like domain-containing protein n=1 Tax=Bondarzewia mesenterica TaxID=1095465 RepID=A0A4S4M2I0_9AGAM|nr:hypothetical protein EW146_g3729 [Bondarzewia mesenterica]
MTVIPRVVAVFAVLASALPLAVATNCGSGEFWYENKSCCVKQGTPQNTGTPPSGKACPSSGNWYWSSDKSCCLPSSEPPSGNPSPTCPSSHSWSDSDSVCNSNTPRGSTSSSDCSSDEFWYSAKSCCLPHGGVPNPPSPPKGSECPSSGWYWGNDQGCCVPHHPPTNNPAPQCPSGWEWISGIYKCQPSPSQPSQPPSTPSGVHHNYKKQHKARASALCPTGLDACPIVNASRLTSDYECLDTTQELESCGGCLSTGAGQDCTAIQGAWNVGCAQGSCAIYNCMTGYRLSADHKTCIAA